MLIQLSKKLKFSKGYQWTPFHVLYLDVELVGGCVAQGEAEGGGVSTGTTHIYVGCNKD